MPPVRRALAGDLRQVIPEAQIHRVQRPAPGGKGARLLRREDAALQDQAALRIRRQACVVVRALAAQVALGRNGYCVAQPGQGAMGIHYLNGGLLDAVLDPLRPEALMYQPTKDGRLELLGVEYIVFQDVWDALHPQPPVLFGHPFHLVRAPNRYNVPAFYELHLWVWEHNRNGIFNDWNPQVRCP